MKHLQQELEQLIHAKAQQLINDEDTYKYMYEHLEYSLLDLIEDAKYLKEDMEKHNLTVSAIESEGYLRFALSVESLLKEVKQEQHEQLC